MYGAFDSTLQLGCLSYRCHRAVLGPAIARVGENLKENGHNLDVKLVGVTEFAWICLGDTDADAPNSVDARRGEIFPLDARRLLKKACRRGRFQFCRRQTPRNISSGRQTPEQKSL